MATLSMTAPGLAHFPCDVDTILARIDAVDPHAHARSRNDLDGAFPSFSRYWKQVRGSIGL